MSVIVQDNGKYHGFVEDAAAAAKLDVVQKSNPGTVRLLTDDEWLKVAAVGPGPGLPITDPKDGKQTWPGNPKRIELCSSLGVVIN